MQATVWACLNLYILTLFLAASLCEANVYTYEDSGAIHLTNVKPSGKEFFVLSKNNEQDAASFHVNDKSFANLRHYENSINHHLFVFGMDPALVKAVIKAESNFNPRAISKRGVQGLMQLILNTAKLMRVNDSFDPEENMKEGIGYLKMLKDTFAPLYL